MKTRDEVVNEAIALLETMRNTDEEYFIAISIAKGEAFRSLHLVNMTSQKVTESLTILARKMKKEFTTAVIAA